MTGPVSGPKTSSALVFCVAPVLVVHYAERTALNRRIWGDVKKHCGLTACGPPSLRLVCLDYSRKWPFREHSH